MKSRGKFVDLYRPKLSPPLHFANNKLSSCLSCNLANILFLSSQPGGHDELRGAVSRSGAGNGQRTV